MRQILRAGASFLICVGVPAADEAEATPAINLQLAYAADALQVFDGGLDRGGAYLDLIDVQLSVDLDKTLGWSGAQFFLYGIYTNGNSIGEKAGDLNGVSNIETGVEAVRVVEAWVDQTFADGQGSLRAGLYDVASEFDAGEVRALFLNSAQGSGTDFSQSGLNGPSMWWVTSAAVRLNWAFEDGVYARAVVADGVSGDPEHPKRTAIDFDDGDGALIAAEAGIAREGRLWSIGVWGYTEAFADLDALSTRTHHNRGAYVALEEALWGRDEIGFDLSGSLRLGVANDDVNSVSSFFGASLVGTGVVAARPDDQLGFAVAVAEIGSKGRQLIADAGGDPANREINIELTYYADITEWLSLQPDLQWIIAPGGDEAVDDAFVAGLRLQLKNNWSVD